MRHACYRIALTSAHQSVRFPIKTTKQTFSRKHQGTMNCVLELNNKAIRCLQDDNAFEACNLLTVASGLCLEATEGQARKRKRMVHRDHIISWVNFSVECTVIDKGDEDSGNPSLYHFAPAIRKPCCQERFATNGTCCQCRDDSDVCPCSISPVVWYNLALSCQILGGKAGSSADDRDFYLMRSLYLYEKVLKLCSHERATESGGLANLRMAVLNNLACIHHEMGRQKDCFEIMKCLKQNLQTFSRRNPRRHMRNWRIFHVNLMMMGSSRPAPAA